MELVRYIHLNPIRAGVVKDVKALDKYPFAGHSVIMGKVNNDWQDIKWVLSLFDNRPWVARRSYRAFVEKGISEGRRSDLTGGGLGPGYSRNQMSAFLVMVILLIRCFR